MYKELDYNGIKIDMIKKDGYYYLNWRPIAKNILGFKDFQRSCVANFKADHVERLLLSPSRQYVKNDFPRLYKKYDGISEGCQLYFVEYKKLLKVVKEQENNEFYGFLLNNNPNRNSNIVSDDSSILKELNEVKARQDKIEEKLDSILNNHSDQALTKINKKLDNILNINTQAKKSRGLFASIFGNQGN